MRLIILFISFILLSQNAMVIFDSKKEKTTDNWFVVNDGVMGGLSQGELTLTKSLYIKFSGTISLENNGGFSSIRYGFKSINGSSSNVFKIRIKGDGKRYQFRVKSSQYDRHSYVAYFETTGEWQDVEIPFNTLKPTFRGYELDLPKFKGEAMEEIGFLVGNKTTEKFDLLIQKIELN